MEGTVKKVLIIVGVVVLVVASAGAYLLLTNNEATEETTQSTSEETSTVENAFSPVSTEGQSFVATINTTLDGEVNEATLSFDGEGKSEYVATANGQTQRFVYTPDAYYSCNDTQGCFKFNLSDSAGPTVDPEEYQFKEEKAQDFNETANYEGQKSCDVGTCDVWVSNSFENQGKTTIYLDARDKKIVKIESTVDGTTSTITYDYKDVTIEVPTDAEELPAGI
jgi:hypothetical protein